MAAEIKMAFRAHYRLRTNAVGLFEFGVCDRKYDVRFDAVVIEPHVETIRGFEFKVSRRDFLSDLKFKKPYNYWTLNCGLHVVDPPKWETYLRFCNRFSFVCPRGLIAPEEVPPPAGLIWVGESNFSKLVVVKPARKICLKMDEKTTSHVLFLFASRAKYRSGDFF